MPNASNIASRSLASAWPCEDANEKSSPARLTSSREGRLESSSCVAKGKESVMRSAILYQHSKQNGGSLGSPAAPFSKPVGLEVDRDAGEHVPTQRVVDLRVGVAVAERRSDRVAAGHRRFRVEDIVRTETQVELVGEPCRQREVEEALRLQVLIARLHESRGDTIRRTGHVRIAAQDIDLDLPEVTPLTGNAETIGQREADAELVPPLRARRTAGRAVETGALILSVQAERRGDQAGVGYEALQIGSDSADIQRAQTAELVRVGRVEVDAAGRQTTDINRPKIDERAWVEPQRSGCIAVDQSADRRVTGCPAEVQDV